MTVLKCIIGHDGNKNNLRRIEAQIVQRLDPISGPSFLGVPGGGGGGGACPRPITLKLFMVLK